MKKEYVVKSLNLIGADVLRLEKGKERIEFATLATALTSASVGGDIKNDSSCWYLLPDFCNSLIPEPSSPTCEMGYSPIPSSGPESPAEQPNPNPQPPVEPSNPNPPQPPLNPWPIPCWSEYPPSQPTDPVSPNPGHGGSGAEEE